MFADKFPFVHPDMPRTTIYGELFRVPSERLFYLDRLESHPDFYCRREI